MKLPNPYSLSRSKVDRREVVSLLGAAMVFFIGLPGHSLGTFITPQHLFRLLLVMLGLTSPSLPPTPVAQHAASPKTIAHAAAPKQAPAKMAGKKIRVNRVEDLMEFSTNSFTRPYTYRFEGVASYQGKPCPHVSVLVRVMMNDDVTTRRAMSQEDGSFSIDVPIVANDGDSVDWSMEAFTTEFQKVELSGRRIVQPRDENPEAPVIVRAPVEFTLASSN